MHSENSISHLRKLVNIHNNKKFEILKHPLYDYMYDLKASCPPEIQDCLSLGKFIYIFFGMIRPYKGALDLLNHYIEQCQSGQQKNSILVLAGKIYDCDLKRYVQDNYHLIINQVIIIDRRLDDAELSYLCQIAHVAVLPYHRILISGSYYLAATFALPAVVPDMGMFATEVTDGHTGIKYPTQDKLNEALLRARSLGKKRLKEIGENARKACAGQEEKDISKKYYETVQSLIE